MAAVPDNLHVNIPLPDAPSGMEEAGLCGRLWKTKSLKCADECLDLTADGRLKYSYSPSGALDLDSWRGELRFYAVIRGALWEYSALFDDGQLINIKRLSPFRHPKGWNVPLKGEEKLPSEAGL